MGLDACLVCVVHVERIRRSAEMLAQEGRANRGLSNMRVGRVGVGKREHLRIRCILPWGVGKKSCRYAEQSHEWYCDIKTFLPQFRWLPSRAFLPTPIIHGALFVLQTPRREAALAEGSEKGSRLKRTKAEWVFGGCFVQSATTRRVCEWTR